MAIDVDDSTWMTTEEAAAYLSTSAGVVRLFVRKHGLPACRFGTGKRSTYRINRHKLDEWLLSRSNRKDE